MRRLFYAALSLTLLVTPAPAAVLYNGSLNSLPGSQNWTYLTNPVLGALATQQIVSGSVQLNTTARTSDQAGYFSRLPLLPASSPNAPFPTLNRATGFTVRLDALIQSESHASANRAGFSVIAIADDLKGLELEFWQDQVWAYNDGSPAGTLFTKGESVAFNTSAGIARYDLAVLGNSYQLYINGSPSLTGSLRDYTQQPDITLMGLTANPYKIPSFLFFGDDTSSANASTRIARFEYLPYAVPEPATLALLLTLGIAPLLRRPLKRPQ